MKAWFDNENFWDNIGTRIFDSFRWEQAEAEVEHILDLVEPAAGARILDMPCGTGRHSLELARRGFRVTGVDRTESFLNDLREAAEKEDLEIDLQKSDMRENLNLSESFDLALNLYTSLGYFTDPADDLKVLKSYYDSLVPGGKLVIELMSKEVLAAMPDSRRWREDEDGSLWLEERNIRSGWDWVDIRWILIGAEGGRKDLRFGHRLYSATELVSILRQAGFDGVATHGDLCGRPYDIGASRLVAVARKRGKSFF